MDIVYFLVGMALGALSLFIAAWLDSGDTLQEIRLHRYKRRQALRERAKAARAELKRLKNIQWGNRWRRPKARPARWLETAFYVGLVLLTAMLVFLTLPGGL